MRLVVKFEMKSFNKANAALLASICFFHYLLAIFVAAFGPKEFRKIASFGFLFNIVINIVVIQNIVILLNNRFLAFIIAYLIFLLCFAWFYYKNTIFNATAFINVS